MRVEQERDHVPGGAILLSMAVVFVVIAIGAVVSWLIDERSTARLGPAPSSSRRPSTVEDINHVEAFYLDERAGALGPTTPELRLEHYGWVSRDQGIVFIPIERAIDLYLEQP